MTTPVDFQAPNLKGLIVSHLKEWFSGQLVGNRPMVMKVLKSWPHDEAQLPCISVHYVSDTLEGKAIGMDFGVVENADGTATERKGAYFRESLEVKYWATVDEMRELVRPRLKVALLSLFETFEELGVQLPQITGGGDDQDFESAKPEELYLLTYNLSFMVPVILLKDWTEIAEGVDVDMSLGEDDGSGGVSIDLDYQGGDQ